MNGTSDIQKRREEIVIDYFHMADAGNPAVIDLFTDDAQMFYPKFGIANGKAQIGAFAQGLGRGIASLQHEFDRFTVLSSGNYVTVEGAERGTTASGIEFPDGVSSFGLFCNVFEFEDELIKRVHIYVDPDFANTHAEGVAWGKSVQDSIASL
ncbi:nuclear transport factor 2 family protein [Streptomyces sp. NBC_00268]|uniref:nuclear transport factor 2 family protein n=1 Tax=Streptomyces sp. NBC_00268 TaxID=2975695 RepID=UPI0022531ED2|nr:nuclear transport factor 2 family protein [Streptomyces sp. NBC_00268]MCX5181196.1 nuclear transport factor 2 family protein [Streptomyces sp. NBC_00268]